MNLAALLRRGDAPPTSADLARAIADAEAEGRGAADRLADLRARRTAALLGDDDRELDRLDAEIARAQRDADRLEAAGLELERRRDEAAEAERRAEVDATFAKGQAAHEAALALLREYGTAAVAMAALLARLRALDAEASATNAAMEAAGDPRRLPESDRVARPQKQAATLMQVPIYDQVRLPSSVEPLMLLHPPGTDVFGCARDPAERPAR